MSFLGLLLDAGQAEAAQNGQYLRKAPLSGGGTRCVGSPDTPLRRDVAPAFSDSQSRTTPLVDTWEHCRIFDRPRASENFFFAVIDSTPRFRLCLADRKFSEEEETSELK
jgi:hypothetical protein